MDNNELHQYYRSKKLLITIIQSKNLLSNMNKMCHTLKGYSAPQKKSIFQINFEFLLYPGSGWFPNDDGVFRSSSNNTVFHKYVLKFRKLQ